MPAINPLTMTDDDFLALGSHEQIPEAPAKSAEEIAAETAAAQAETDRLAAEAATAEAGKTTEAPAKTPEELAEEQRLADEEAAKSKTEPTQEEKDLAAAEAAKAKPELNADGTPKTPAPAPKPGEATAPVASAPGSTAAAPAVVINYEEAYKEMMKPFKANGKLIEPRTPQEAIQLMQMGANYTRKLQELQPSKKLLMMLDNNGLLDEAQLSFLIDLHKKNPEAIKKLVKDSGLDPMEMDVTAETTYQAGNHAVSDAEATFATTLEEVRSQPDGQASLTRMNTDWDQASKEVLWAKPELMPIFHQQIASGIYDLIETEVTRRRVLGQIPTTTPFLQAYKLVGDEMQAEGKLAPKTAPTQKAAPVATTVAAPKPAATNGAQASAASPTRSTPRAVAKTVNPLAMSDEEFLKQMADRV